MSDGCLWRFEAARVADLMAEDRYQLGFRIEMGQDAAVDVDVAARQGHGIDYRIVEHGKRPVQIGPFGGGRDPFPEFLDVGLPLGIIVGTEGGEHLRMGLRPHLDLLGLRHQRELPLTGGRIHRAGGDQEQTETRPSRPLRALFPGDGHFRTPVRSCT